MAWPAESLIFAPLRALLDVDPHFGYCSGTKSITRMDIKRETVSDSEVKLTITISPEEVQPFLVTAARHISEHMNIDGFRRGKAPYEAIVNNVGEMRVLEEAIEPMVRLHVAKALMDEKIESIGQPRVDIEKMVPGNELVFTATVTLMPEVSKIASYDKLTVEGKSTKAEEKDIEKAIKELTGMQTKEVRAPKDTEVTMDQMVVIDLEMKRDLVPVEGGSTQGFRVYMQEDHYVPGMKDEMLGMKEGDQKVFTLAFPKEHFQKHLAGAPVDFDVTVKEIYALESPTVDDAFAVSLGLKGVADLHEKIAENLEKENEEQEKRRIEREALELLAEKSAFGTIPEFLVEDEVEKMVHELEHAVTSRGGVFDDYMKSLGKTAGELREGMRDQGLLRVKVALLLRAIGTKEGLDVSNDDVQEEIEKQLALYKEDDEARDKLSSDAYRDYMRYRMRNEKVVDFLLEKMVKKA
ncbi:trigger factor [Candidatus Uhrbacteria bacterium CG10_big_fil_rev_8_21_14_0_10_50_16]|uniref:Trigger factor n=1 Tax=Candidatus Uhrbacteria bacterium CG10_big_fil_rev_8_21_14_0_10_50_16 TaxID=1975039 RepID=A0A2H0RLY2_9BACT|nr:MAG: trigger factor [Candidatus Uhrbacteria bacterium CG10_big_fil_rev_8_21_14_0_10_50_16]